MYLIWNLIFRTFSDVMAKNNKPDGFKLFNRKSRVVYGKSYVVRVRAASETLYDAYISGVDCVYPENDFIDFLKGHNIQFNYVKCYSKEDSLSKTFKVTSRQSLWDTDLSSNIDEYNEVLSTTKPSIHHN